MSIERPSTDRGAKREAIRAMCRHGPIVWCRIVVPVINHQMWVPLGAGWGSIPLTRSLRKDCFWPSTRIRIPLQTSAIGH
jgi:hypothetical protein